MSSSLSLEPIENHKPPKFVTLNAPDVEQNATLSELFTKRRTDPNHYTVIQPYDYEAGKALVKSLQARSNATWTSPDWVTLYFEEHYYTLQANRGLEGHGEV